MTTQPQKTIKEKIEDWKTIIPIQYHRLVEVIIKCAEMKGKNKAIKELLKEMKNDQH